MAMASIPVLFIHGMYLTGQSWSRWCDRFSSRGFACSAPSWPGRDGNPAHLREHVDPRLASLTLSDIVAEYEQRARADARTIVIGHSMGGLVAQILLARGAAAMAIAIDSAPPHGVRSFAWSHLRANAPVLRPGSAPIVPSLAAWRYAFWHTGSIDEVKQAFDTEVVPESRLVGRGPLGREAAVDFTAPRGPLLMIAGELDRIIPASLNRKNAARYPASSGATELVEMKGRTHYLCGQPGWEEVADTCLTWLDRNAARTPATATGAR
jgi:pimeloyl-ACP methyl ester carboxylesterase